MPGHTHSRRPWSRQALRARLFPLAVALCAALACITHSLRGADATNVPIDLVTVLRLAGAQNLDIQIARERLAEARANYGSAIEQFFPTFSPGITYRRHDDNIQDVAGSILEIHKQSYAPGATINAQVELGEAYYKQLAAKQLVKAASAGAETQRHISTAAAAQGYYDLLAANAAVAVAADAVTISSNYAAQIAQAVGAGIEFKGDELRVRVETERNLLTVRRAQEERRVAAATLAQTLHLDTSADLEPRAEDLVPVTLLQTNAMALLAQAIASRPELKQSDAQVASARESKKATTYGPLVPTVGAQAFFGGLGGGRQDAWDSFDRQEDYMVGLSWRLGPGGIFDFDRQHAAEARVRVTELTRQKVRDQVSAEVMSASARADSLRDQLATAQRAMRVAEEGLRLTQQRREFGVGIVLEAIQSEQDFTRARLEYVRTIAEFNKAQYSLAKAVGAL